jgi:hypothetical protein
LLQKTPYTQQQPTDRSKHRFSVSVSDLGCKLAVQAAASSKEGSQNLIFSIFVVVSTKPHSYIRNFEEI